MAQVAVCSQINTKHINTVWAERTVVECYTAKVNLEKKCGVDKTKTVDSVQNISLCKLKQVTSRMSRNIKRVREFIHLLLYIKTTSFIYTSDMIDRGKASNRFILNTTQS